MESKYTSLLETLTGLVKEVTQLKNDSFEVPETFEECQNYLRSDEFQERFYKEDPKYYTVNDEKVMNKFVKIINTRMEEDTNTTVTTDREFYVYNDTLIQANSWIHAYVIYNQQIYPNAREIWVSKLNEMQPLVTLTQFMCALYEEDKNCLMKIKKVLT